MSAHFLFATQRLYDIEEHFLLNAIFFFGGGQYSQCYIDNIFHCMKSESLFLGFFKRGLVLFFSK